MVGARRIAREHRLAIGAVGAAFGAVLVLFVGVLYPWEGRVETLRQQAVTARQSLVAAEEAHRQTERTRDDAGRARGALERLYGQVLPQSLAGARGITYLSLAELAVAHGLVLERRSTAPEDDRDRRLVQLRTTMSLAGEWPDMRRFIHDVEAAPDFLVIEEISLSQGEGAGAPLVLTLGLSTFYARPEDS